MPEKPRRGFPIELPITSVVFRIYPTSPEKLEEMGILKLRIDVDPKGRKGLIAVDEEGNVWNISNWLDEGLKAMFVVRTYWWKGKKEPPEKAIVRYFTKMFKGVWNDVWGTISENMSIVDVQRARRGYRVTVNVPASLEWVRNLREKVKMKGRKRAYGQHVLFVPGDYDVWLPVLHHYLRSKGMDIESELMADLARHAGNEKELSKKADLLIARLNALSETLRSIENSLQKAVNAENSKHGLKVLESEIERLQKDLHMAKKAGNKRKKVSTEHHMWYIGAILTGASKAKDPKKVIEHHLEMIRNDINILQQARSMLLDIQRRNRERIRKVLEIRKMLGIDDEYNIVNLSRRLKEPSGQQASRSP